MFGISKNQTLPGTSFTTSYLLVCEVVMTLLIAYSAKISSSEASPAALVASIIEDLQTALEQFTAIAEDLGGLKAKGSTTGK